MIHCAHKIMPKTQKWNVYPNRYGMHSPVFKMSPTYVSNFELHISTVYTNQTEKTVGMLLIKTIYLFRVVRMTSPKLNYLIVTGSLLMYCSVFIQLLYSTDRTTAHVQCIVSTAYICLGVLCIQPMYSISTTYTCISTLS